MGNGTPPAEWEQGLVPLPQHSRAQHLLLVQAWCNKTGDRDSSSFPTQLQRFSCIPWLRCSYTHKEPPVTSLLTPPPSKSPFMSIFAVTNHDKPLSLNHSQPPAPPNQASEYSEDALSAQLGGFILQGVKPKGTLGSNGDMIRLAAASWTVFPPLLQLLELEMQERGNKSIRQRSQRHFSVLACRSRSSGRA